MMPTSASSDLKFCRFDHVKDGVLSKTYQLLTNIVIREIQVEPIRATCLLACVLREEFLEIVGRTIWRNIAMPLVPDPRIQSNL